MLPYVRLRSVLLEAHQNRWQYSTTCERLQVACTCVVPHEHLQGLATFVDADGRRRTKWKTTLAGMYPPELCRSLALVVRLCAPPGAWAGHGQRRHEPRWREELGAAVETRPAHKAIRPCPRAFRCPWDDAVKFSLRDDSRVRRLSAQRRLEEKSQSKGSRPTAAS